MNIIIDRLPNCTYAQGQRLPIVTDYRAAVEFEILIDKGEDDVQRLLSPFYPQGIPLDPQEAVAGVLWFYRCGEAPVETKSKKAKGYSFEMDADVIFADFWRFYNIDLSAEALHWWTFRALLAGLPDDSGYKQRIYYRTCELKGLPKAEQDRIKRIRDIIAIKKNKRSTLTLEERNALMLEYAARRSAEVAKGE